MASAVARTYNGCLGAKPLGAKPLVGVQGAERPEEARGQSSLKLTSFFVFKTVIFNTSAAFLLEMMYCLSCFSFAQVYGFTFTICFM